MKYGTELAKRSVPQWRAHNLDYNDIKRLIKRATSGSEPNQRAIDELVALLFEELERINLFVKSKSGEINRRISDCEKIVAAVAARERRKSTSSRNGLLGELSQGSQTRVFKLHRELSRINNDIQDLSRFIGAQRTGFRKLIKKFRKWSNSDRLAREFLPQLEAPGSFANHDFTANFLELSVLYDVVRNNSFASLTGHAGSPGTTASSLDPPKQSMCRFDCQMTSSVANSIVFWVHPDNIVEAKVALLKHLALYSTDDATASGGEEEDAPEDLTSVIYLDDEKFHSISNDAGPGQLRWVKDPFVDYTVLCSPVGGIRHFASLSVSRQQTQDILSGEVHHKDIDARGDANAKMALGWVKKRRAVPVSKASCKRTRYVLYGEPESYLSDTAGSGSSGNLTISDEPFIWATIDENIKLTYNGRCDTQDVDAAADVSTFPYALLEIRWKNLNKPAWIGDFEAGIAKPVPGFSLYAYAVALYYKSSLQSLPCWMALIEKNVDIRQGRKRRSSSRSVPTSRTVSGVTTPVLPTSMSCANSILLNEHSMDYFSGKHHNNTLAVPALDEHTTSEDNISLSSGQMLHRASNPLDVYGTPQNKPVVRYWNEFDDPDEGNDGAFFVDPELAQGDGEHGIFSRRNVDSLVRFGDKFVQKISRIKDRLGLERRPLLSRVNSAESFDDDDRTSIASHASFSYKPHRHDYGYDTFPDEEGVEYIIPEDKSRDVVLTVFYSICFFISALMIFTLFGVIAGEDMDAISNGAFVFIITGLLIALGIGIMGMCLFLLRNVPSWWHQSIVLTVFFSIVCFGVGGIAWMLA
ncbi:hypothetical protein TRVA0_037S01288 [Trichomonascus vanleenenianus]|uniref:Vtc5p n=1 Tax=Trichomonascus vanleenenianus TaxID=2268995 RepID=UPI003ECB45D9